MGVPTGFHDLDNLTGGLHDSELIILAARPSMGKTALATNIAENVAIQSNVTTLFVSLEMARQELAQRMLCSQGHIDANKFRSGFLSGDDRRKLVEASAKLGKAPIFVDDTPARSMTEIAACARRLKRKHDLGLMVIDYLQLIQPDDSRDPRQEQVAKMARRLKVSRPRTKGTHSLPCPVEPANRGRRQGRAPSKTQPPARVGAIEQDADVVLFIHREEYYQDREEAQQSGTAGMAEVMIAKQRNGQSGVSVKLAWFSKHTCFENLANKPYEEFSEYSAEEF